MDQFGGESVGSLRSIIRSTFDYELDDLRDYVRTIEKAFEENLEAHRHAFEERAKGMTAEEYEWHSEFFNDDWYQFGLNFPSLLWQTAFMHLYFHFEHSLIHLCNTVRRAGNFGEDVTGREKDKGITAAQKYLTNVAKLNFPFVGQKHGPIWRDILQMNALRNLFAHNMGQIEFSPQEDPVDKLSDELRHYIERQNGLIVIDSIGRIRLNNGYCLKVIDQLREFFADILTAVPGHLIP